jgi:uncharacterized protein YjbJ (UPF0337 family)
MRARGPFATLARGDEEPVHIETNRRPLMGGTGDKAKGKIKESYGKMTDDKSREYEGKLDQKKGDAKDKGEDFGDRVERSTD